jgi:hypothetical protein
MKPRNGEDWTKEDKALLQEEFRRLARATPGFLLFMLPGGALLLPAYAWFLDTRRGKRYALPQ